MDKKGDYFAFNGYSGCISAVRAALERTAGVE
jgi:hypothetical protein